MKLTRVLGDCVRFDVAKTSDTRMFATSLPVVDPACAAGEGGCRARRTTAQVGSGGIFFQELCRLCG